MTAATLARAQTTEDRSPTLGLETAYLGLLSTSAMGLLWALPPEDSQWYDKPELSAHGFYHRWRQNVARGPVWDGDMRFFNGYGHIHSGAAYTMICLNNGYGNLACTAYANAVSLAWEYGPEAIIEVPSYQDILMTGMVGARVGIAFYQWQTHLEARGDTLFGSRILGAVAGFALNPFGKLTRGFVNLFHDGPVQTVGMPYYKAKGSDGESQFGFTWSILL